MREIPLFARYFGNNVLVQMLDYDGKVDSVDIDYIYDAFKTRFFAELQAEGYKLVKTDE